jgi:hypothetical protein
MLFAFVQAQSLDSASIGSQKSAYKFIVNLDARRTTVFKEPVRYYGIRLGILKGKNIFALGFYGLDDPWLDPNVVVSERGGKKADLRSKLRYACLIHEHIWLDNKHWQLSTPASIGFGDIAVDYLDSTAGFLPLTRRAVFPLEFGAKGAYKVFFWLHIQGGVSYRKVISSYGRADRIYSGPTWTYGLSIKFGQIIQYAKERIKDRRTQRTKEHGTP